MQMQPAGQLTALFKGVQANEFLEILEAAKEGKKGHVFFIDANILNFITKKLSINDPRKGWPSNKAI
jgi:hypothetical protein